LERYLEFQEYAEFLYVSRSQVGNRKKKEDTNLVLQGGTGRDGQQAPARGAEDQQGDSQGASTWTKYL
jgi:hypothetical protein